MSSIEREKFITPDRMSYSSINMNNRSQSYLVSENDESCWSRKTKLEKSLIIICLFAVVLSLCLIIAIVVVRNNSSNLDKKKYEVCDSKVCRDIEEELMSSINRSIDPCDDFYSYVCSGWIKSNPLPATESSWNSFDVVEHRVNDQLKKILQEMTTSENAMDIKVRDLYTGCINQGKRDEIGVKPLKVLANQLGSWPLLGGPFDHNYDWTKSLAWSIRELGYSVLISIEVSADSKNTARNIIHLDYASLGLGRKELLNASDEQSLREISAYKKLIEETANLLSTTKENSTLHREIDEIVDFEMKLATFTRPEEDRRIPESLYHKMKISEFENYTEGKMNLLTILSEVFQDIANITEDTEIIVVEPESLKNISKFLQTVEKRIIANYIGWRTINKYSSFTTKIFREKKFEFLKVKKGLEKMDSIENVCIKAVDFELSYALGNIFINRTFNEDTKIEIERMIEDIQEAFSSFLTLSDWMDVETKRKAKKKLHEMIPLIAYPPWIMNETELNEYYEKLGEIKEEEFFQSILNIDKFVMYKELIKINEPRHREKDSWFESPTTVNAYYSPDSNTIAFPAGILQFPFFKFGIPTAINYGAIGTVIGHEITHGFDDEGSKYDQFGNLRHWWPSKIEQTFSNKTECFVNQYSSYEDPHTNMKLNGKNTLGENIADNGGLRASYKAYQLYLTKYGMDNNKMLPTLGLTPNQLFFVGFSYLWCMNQRTEYLRNLIEYNPHSPAQFRVWGTLANNEDFYKAFKCNSKSKMFSEKRCLLW
ncbi:neprilysin-1-like isoform X2 [Centruroides sculpturatus]|uniref:neprilysin-1-like isoform X2 n=1 Tax=Centruroides sculpturatus TaxID=218467 RepID=UPI000C6C9D76|nr:neprilysin-1-like isoform X2 [Centruroides sculpturatus]